MTYDDALGKNLGKKLCGIDLIVLNLWQWTSSQKCIFFFSKMSKILKVLDSQNVEMDHFFFIISQRDKFNGGKEFRMKHLANISKY